MKSSLHSSPLGDRINACCLWSWLDAARKPPRWLAMLLLALAAVLAAPAQAQTTGKMWFISTTEPSYPTYLTNAWTAFSNYAPKKNLTPVNDSGVLSGATPLSVPAGTKLVVVEMVVNPVNTARLGELITLIKTRPDLAIVIFSDGCCVAQDNVNPLVAAFNTIRPASWTSPIATVIPLFSGSYSAPLNPTSLYASTFSNAGLNVLNGVAYTPLTSVPRDYALYTQTKLPASPPATVTQNIVGFFMPQAAVNGGQGACLFFVGDASPFDSGYSSQLAPIAEAFTDAAINASGACAQPVAGAPDLWSQLSEPDGLVTGVAAPMTLTVGNSGAPGVVASTDGQVSMTLPTGLTLDSFTPPATGIVPGSCTTTSTSFSCTLATLNPGDTIKFNFDVIAPVAIPQASAVNLTATVSGVTNEVNQNNNNSTLKGIATSDGDPDLSISLALKNLLYTGVANTLTLTVSNSNLPGVTSSTPGTAHVTLPDGLGLDPNSDNPVPAGCTADDATNTSFTCQVPGLVNGGQQGFPFQVIAPAPILADDLEVTAQVTIPGAGEVDIANNTTALQGITTNDSPDVSATVSVPSTLPVGTPITMTLTVSNSSEPDVGVAPAGSIATVTLPAGLELASGSRPPTGCTADATNTVFTCTVNTILNPGDSVPFAFQVIAPAPTGKVQIETGVTWPSIGGVMATGEPILRDIYAAQSNPIPTLTELALALLALAVAASAATGLRRRG
ncbi:MAG: DUF1326 domain-containing protein [Burkholderiaceae bacterium]|jgi:hypothetical protein|nr:DUF1326 domain-containing protein [Burkholderiaceae bacterium]